MGILGLSFRIIGSFCLICGRKWIFGLYRAGVFFVINYLVWSVEGLWFWKFLVGLVVVFVFRSESVLLVEFW